MTITTSNIWPSLTVWIYYFPVMWYISAHPASPTGFQHPNYIKAFKHIQINDIVPQYKACLHRLSIKLIISKLICGWQKKSSMYFLGVSRPNHSDYCILGAPVMWGNLNTQITSNTYIITWLNALFIFHFFWLVYFLLWWDMLQFSAKSTSREIMVLAFNADACECHENDKNFTVRAQIERYVFLFWSGNLSASSLSQWRDLGTWTTTGTTVPKLS